MQYWHDPALHASMASARYGMCSTVGHNRRGQSLIPTTIDKSESKLAAEYF